MQILLQILQDRVRLEICEIASVVRLLDGGGQDDRPVADAVVVDDGERGVGADEVGVEAPLARGLCHGAEEDVDAVSALEAGTFDVEEVGAGLLGGDGDVRDCRRIVVILAFDFAKWARDAG